MTPEPLDRLHPDDRLLVGGDRFVRVGDDLAAAFRTGDQIVVVHDTAAVLHIPADVGAAVRADVTAAAAAFGELSAVGDDAITAFFDRFAALLDDDRAFAPIAEANRADLVDARDRGRPVGRLELTPSMRAAMIAGLRTWRDLPLRRRQLVGEIVHEGWVVEQWRDPLGVVGFVFEGRPNVFADAAGVLRTGNTAVFRIGGDALGTATAIMRSAVEPALAAAGLPPDALRLVGSRAHAAGWALFADRRLALAVGRGSGPAVAQLGAVARQHGVAVSLHGTGGAWLVAGETADSARFAAAVRHSLDRKVCNTLNVCCIVRSREVDLVPVFLDAASDAARARSADPIVHRLDIDDPSLAREWEWDAIPEVALVVVDDIAAAVDAFNRFSPHFVASLVSADAAEHEWFYAAVDAPFIGDGLTRWVDGQFALSTPELGLSNWQTGRLLGRGGVLSGDSVHTVRLRARIADIDLHR
ncbi:MAG: aldehyde dehydrogenase family protein [Ilumatobacteraceae bacterium]